MRCGGGAQTDDNNNTSKYDECSENWFWETGEGVCNNIENDLKFTL